MSYGYLSDGLSIQAYFVVRRGLEIWHLSRLGITPVHTHGKTPWILYLEFLTTLIIEIGRFCCVSTFIYTSLIQLACPYQVMARASRCKSLTQSVSNLHIEIRLSDVFIWLAQYPIQH